MEEGLKQRIQQSGALTFGRLLELVLPAGDDGFKLAAERGHTRDLTIEISELSHGQGMYLAARGATAVTHTHNTRQIIETKSDGERVTNQPHAIRSFRRVLLVSGGRPRRTRKNAMRS